MGDFFVSTTQLMGLDPTPGGAVWFSEKPPNGAVEQQCDLIPEFAWLMAVARSLAAFIAGS